MRLPMPLPWRCRPENDADTEEDALVSADDDDDWSTAAAAAGKS